MKSRELFLLAVKVIGFVVVLYGIQNVIDSLMISMGYANVNLSTPRYWAARGFIKIVAGVYLMVGSTPLVNQLYSQKPEAAEDAPEATPNTDNVIAAKGNERLMQPKVIFAVVVKTVGLIVVLYGLEYFVGSLMYSLKAPETTDADKGWLVRSIIEIAFGLALMRGIVPLVDFAFPGEITKTQDD